MSANDGAGRYCSVCHKKRPLSHFQDRPDHAAGGPKLTLAERREMGEQPASGASASASEGSPWVGLAIFGAALLVFVGVPAAVGTWQARHAGDAGDAGA